jgi:Protein of unknown function (DUF3455)
MRRARTMRLGSSLPLRAVAPALAIASLALACGRDPGPSSAPGAPEPQATLATAALPHVPDRIKVAEDEVLVTREGAQGVQIYQCAATDADPTKFEWKHMGPKAVLTDDANHNVGTHSFGPTWESVDGSKVTAEVKQKIEAPDKRGAAWLLLHATSNAGTGVFSKVTSIQRVDTVGGKPPTDPCTADTAGTHQDVPYRATYYFYAAH